MQGVTVTVKEVKKEGGGMEYLMSRSWNEKSNKKNDGMMSGSYKSEEIVLDKMPEELMKYFKEGPMGAKSDKRIEDIAEAMGEAKKEDKKKKKKPMHKMPSGEMMAGKSHKKGMYGRMGK